MKFHSNLILIDITDNAYFYGESFWNLEVYKGKGKAIPLQAWIGPEGSRQSAHVQKFFEFIIVIEQ